MGDLHGPGHCACHAEIRDTDPFGQDLFPYIDNGRVYCLNEETAGSSQQLFRPRAEMLQWDNTVRSQDGDAELLMFVPFISPVKLTAISVIGGGGGSTPNKVRLFPNRELTFEEVHSSAPAQEFELLENPSGELEFATRVSRFQSVNTLSLHFPASTGLSYSELLYIGLKGECSGLRREAVIAVYEARPVLADHPAPRDDFSNRRPVA